MDDPTIKPRTRSNAAAIRNAQMSFFGWLFIVVGVAACCYFLFIYDTTRTPKFPAGSTERIYNQGLMQNRQLGAIGGMALTIIGTMMVIAVPAKQ